MPKEIVSDPENKMIKKWLLQILSPSFGRERQTWWIASGSCEITFQEKQGNVNLHVDE